AEPGINDRRSDRFALRRIQVDQWDWLLDFRAKVAGAHDTALPLRASYRRHRYGRMPALSEGSARRRPPARAGPSPVTSPRAAGEVVIVGAGPYGLAVAAHLRAAGVAPRVFGETMGYWREHMPRDMARRSGA